jgi:hypothetical protein
MFGFLVMICMQPNVCSQQIQDFSSRKICEVARRSFIELHARNENMMISHCIKEDTE